MNKFSIITIAVVALFVLLAVFVPSQTVGETVNALRFGAGVALLALYGTLALESLKSKVTSASQRFSVGIALIGLGLVSASIWHGAGFIWHFSTDPVVSSVTAGTILLQGVGALLLMTTPGQSPEMTRSRKLLLLGVAVFGVAVGYGLSVFGVG